MQNTQSAEMGEFMDPVKTVSSFGISPGMHIADFGCGSGFFSVILGRAVGESGLVTAVDVLESALDVIRGKAKLEGLNNIQTVRANIEVLGGSGLANSSQDLVLMKNVLYQSSEKLNIIKEAARVLIDDGKLIIIDWKKGAGGLGPPDNIRADAGTIKNLTSGTGLTLENEIPVDAFHYGFVFRKVK